MYLLKVTQQLHVAQSSDDDILGVTVGSQKAHAQVLVDPQSTVYATHGSTEPTHVKCQPTIQLNIPVATHGANTEQSA